MKSRRILIAGILIVGSIHSYAQVESGKVDSRMRMVAVNRLADPVKGPGGRIKPEKGAINKSKGAKSNVHSSSAKPRFSGSSRPFQKIANFKFHERRRWYSMGCPTF